MIRNARGCDSCAPGAVRAATLLVLLFSMQSRIGARPLEYLFTIRGWGNSVVLATPRILFFDDTYEELYVVNGDGSIHIYSAQGGFLYRFGKNEGVGNPQGLVVGGNGLTYISQGLTGEILVCNYRGVIDHRYAFAGEPRLTRPWQLAVDGENNLYVVDQATKSIFIYDDEERLLGRISDDARFTSISDLAIDDDGRLYVMNSVSAEIHVYDSKSGEHLLSFGMRGSGTGKMSAPVAIAVYDSRRVFVLDTNRQKILIFTTAGAFVDEIGNLGRGDYGFFYPSDISVSRSGVLYVCDTMNNRVQAFAVEGAPQG